MEYAFLFAMGEEVGIQGPFNPRVAAGSSQFPDLFRDEVDIHPKQQGRGVDAGIQPSIAKPLEAEHRFIKAAVPRVDLDENVGAFVDIPPVDKNNMEERAHYQF